MRRLEDQITTVKEDVKEIKDILRSNYVTQDQFGPVKQVVFGLVALILISVVGALLVLVIRQGS